MRKAVHLSHVWRSRLRLLLISLLAASFLILLFRRNCNTQLYTILGPNLLRHYTVNQFNDKETVDFFLNVRKLTLWAVRQLNQRVKGNFANESEIYTQLWWADPTKTVDVRSAPLKHGILHDITFLADPGHVPFSVQIFQRKVTTLEGEELEVVGRFTRLAPQGGAARVAEEPPAELHQTHDEYFKVGD